MRLQTKAFENALNKLRLSNFKRARILLSKHVVASKTSVFTVLGGHDEACGRFVERPAEQVPDL